MGIITPNALSLRSTKAKRHCVVRICNKSELVSSLPYGGHGAAIGDAFSFLTPFQKAATTEEENAFHASGERKLGQPESSGSIPFFHLDRVDLLDFQAGERRFTSQGVRATGGNFSWAWHANKGLQHTHTHTPPHYHHHHQLPDWTALSFPSTGSLGHPVPAVAVQVGNSSQRLSPVSSMLRGNQNKQTKMCDKT